MRQEDLSDIKFLNGLITHSSDVDKYIIQKTYKKVWPAKQNEHPQIHMKWTWEQDIHNKLLGKRICMEWCPNQIKYSEKWQTICYILRPLQLAGNQ